MRWPHATLRTSTYCAIAVGLTTAILPGNGSFASAPEAMRNCSVEEKADFPKAIISNASVRAVVYLPDALHGYYRATRFDWSGVVGCLSAGGHTYFGQWFPRYDPFVNDSISGPVEEFTSQDGALNYADAGVGGLFVKPGVGVLRKMNEKPYSSFVTYPLVDGGKWSVKTGKDGVRFTQNLQSSVGIAYRYTKELRLEKHDPVLVLKHELKNSGTKSMELDVYDHDFFVLDGQPTGPDMVVRLPFTPVLEHPLANGGQLIGNEIGYVAELQQRQTVNSFITGFTDKTSDYNIEVENRRTGIGVQQTSDRPLSRMNFWSIRTTICPEGYIHLSIPPGQTARWTIRYRFYS